MNELITADNVAHSCMTGLRKSIGMFVQHANYMESESLRNFGLVIRVIL